jgi:hypothetical protein
VKESALTTELANQPRQATPEHASVLIVAQLSGAPEPMFAVIEKRL